MKRTRLLLALIPALLIGISVGCLNAPKSPDVSDSIRKSLDQSGYKDVGVKQDREKGVVTLSGTVPTENDKLQAESIAKSIAGSQVVANEIAVRPSGDESTAKKVESDLDNALKRIWTPFLYNTNSIRELVTT